MANLTLYREFYHINHTSFSDDAYMLIAPVTLSANTYIKNSTALTETLIVHNESTGIYFVNLNPILYSFDNIYELVWSVVYNTISPVKTLITRFKLNPYNISSDIDIEINAPSYGIEIEILGRI